MAFKLKNMMYSLIKNLTKLLLFSLFLFSCKKEALNDNETPKEDYRLKYTGDYTCVGTTTYYYSANGDGGNYTNTINLIVKLDSTSKNRIYINDDRIEIDTTGNSVSVPYTATFFSCSFFAEDSIKYYFLNAHSSYYLEKVYSGRK